MKTLKLTLSIAIVAIALITGCKKDDTEAPVITLNGSATETKSLNSSYADPSATANDNEDGSITVTSDFSSTNPNMNLAGTYTITYSATDAAGNEGTATRIVIVKNDASYLAGTYNVTEQPGGAAWTQSITASPTTNNRIIFSKFGNYTNNSAIFATVTGTVDISSQSATGIGASGCNHNFTPNGTGNAITQPTSGVYTFSIKYTDENTGGGGSCTASTVSYEDTFQKQ